MKLQVVFVLIAMCLVALSQATSKDDCKNHKGCWYNGTCYEERFTMAGLDCGCRKNSNNKGSRIWCLNRKSGDEKNECKGCLVNQKCVPDGQVKKVGQLTCMCKNKTYSCTFWIPPVKCEDCEKDGKCYKEKEKANGCTCINKKWMCKKRGKRQMEEAFAGGVMGIRPGGGCYYEGRWFKHGDLMRINDEVCVCHKFQYKCSSINTWQSGEIYPPLPTPSPPPGTGCMLEDKEYHVHYQVFNCWCLANHHWSCNPPANCDGCLRSDLSCAKEGEQGINKKCTCKYSVWNC